MSQGESASIKCQAATDIRPPSDRTTLDHLLSTTQTAAYTGVDPTASSLHLGHLIPYMLLFWLHGLGHNVTMLVGGGTARIGDPAGRLTARTTLETNSVMRNAASISAQLGQLSDSAARLIQRHGIKPLHLHAGPATRTVDDNFRYLSRLTMVDFLGVVGAVSRVGTMLGRDTVRTRLQGTGMSFAEFTYPLVQAYDWWHLYNECGVQIQIGGSDQYGNIVAGQDVIKALCDRASSTTGGNPAGPETVVDKSAEPKRPIGLTVPLLTTASGEKFGKSAGNAIWLDADYTSPFKLYGILLGTSDADVPSHLRLLTFVPNEKVGQVMDEHSRDPSLRIAQHLLAYEVCDLVHGEQIAMETRRQHTSMRTPSLSRVLADLESDSTVVLSRKSLDDAMSKILARIGMAESNGRGARMISGGGIYAATTGARAVTVASSTDDKADQTTLRFEPVVKATDPAIQYVLPDRDVLVLRKGKWDVTVVKFTDQTIG